MTAVIKRVEEERQSKTSATAWTLEQRVQAWYIHDAAGALQPFSPGLLTRSGQDWTKGTPTGHPQQRPFMWYSMMAKLFFFFIFPNFQWQRGEQCCASVFFIVQYCSALIPLFFHSICSQCQQSLKCQTKCDKDDDRGWEEGGMATTLLLSDPSKPIQ